MRKLFPVKKLIILVTILALPGFLYYLLQEKGKNRYRPLPIMGPKRVAATYHTRRGVKIPDTVYHTIGSFKLVNQEADTIKFPADTVQLTVVNFFFTRCPSFCGNMNHEMERVAREFERNNLVKFISVSVDPDYDTSPVLNQYAKRYHFRPGQWQFLTGSQQEIFKLAKQDFLVDAVRDTTQAANIIHSPMLILVDPERRIRGYYDSGAKEQVDKLIDEIKVLIAEELRRVKAGGF